MSVLLSSNLVSYLNTGLKCRFLSPTCSLQATWQSSLHHCLTVVTGGISAGFHVGEILVSRSQTWQIMRHQCVCTLTRIILNAVNTFYGTFRHFSSTFFQIKGLSHCYRIHCGALQSITSLIPAWRADKLCLWVTGPRMSWKEENEASKWSRLCKQGCGTSSSTLRRSLFFQPKL